MLQLFASKLGPMTTNGPFDASVYSIFKRVVNLRLEDSTILSIGSSELFNCPGLIRCHPHHQLDFQHFINHNMSAVCRSELIQIGKSIVIELKTGEKWEERIDQNIPGTLPNYWNEFYKLVASSDRFETVQNIVNGKNFLKKNFDCIFHELRPLVGKGPGLTPLGDDFIIGIAAGCWGYRYKQAFFSNWLSSITHLTSDLSRQGLICAAHGWFCEPIIDFLKELTNPVKPHHWPKLLTIGNTSGIAMAYGCLVGLKIGSYSTNKHKKINSITPNERKTLW